MTSAAVSVVSGALVQVAEDHRCDQDGTGQAERLAGRSGRISARLSGRRRPVRSWRGRGPEITRHTRARRQARNRCFWLVREPHRWLWLCSPRAGSGALPHTQRGDEGAGALRYADGIFPRHSRPAFPPPTRFNHQGSINSTCRFEYLTIGTSPAYWSDRVRGNEGMFSINTIGWIVKSLPRDSDPVARAEEEAAGDH